MLASSAVTPYAGAIGSMVQAIQALLLGGQSRTATAGAKEAFGAPRSANTSRALRLAGWPHAPTSTARAQAAQAAQVREHSLPGSIAATSQEAFTAGSSSQSPWWWGNCHRCFGRITSGQTPQNSSLLGQHTGVALQY